MSPIKTRQRIAFLISFINLANKTHPNNFKHGILKTFKGVALVLKAKKKTLTADDFTTFKYATAQ